MNWTEVTIKTTTEAVEAISNILMEERCGGVMIEDPKDTLHVRDTRLQSYSNLLSLCPISCFFCMKLRLFSSPLACSALKHILNKN